MVTKKEEKKGASLKPSEFAEGGGLFQGEATWRNPRLELFDYGGTGPSSPGLIVDLETEEGETIKQFWSAGNSDDWTPSKDKTKLIPIGKASRLSKSSNLYHLLNSLVEAGFPEDKMEDDVSIYDGMKCDMVRVPAPERKGLQKKEKKYEDTILKVDSIIALPWEEDKVSKKGKEKAQENDAVTENVVENAIKAVKGIINDEVFMKSHKDGIKRMTLAGEVFNRMKKALSASGVSQKNIPSHVNPVTMLIAGKDDSFISNPPFDPERGLPAWEYDSKTQLITAPEYQE